MSERLPGPTAGQTYTSTVVALVPASVATVASMGLALLVLALTGAPGWAMPIGLVVMAAVVTPFGLHLATVRLTIGACALSVGQGMRGRARWVPVADVMECRCESLRWPQVYGIGIRQALRLTRLTVRPGPTLWLALSGGEHLWISTADPEAACRLLDQYRTTERYPREEAGS